MKFPKEVMDQLPDHLIEEYDTLSEQIVRDLYEQGLWLELNHFLSLIANFLDDTADQENMTISMDCPDVVELMQIMLIAAPFIQFMVDSPYVERLTMAENAIIIKTQGHNQKEFIKKLKSFDFIQRQEDECP